MHQSLLGQRRGEMVCIFRLFTTDPWGDQEPEFILNESVSAEDIASH